MYSDEYMNSLLSEMRSYRPRIEELEKIICCPDSNATVSEQKEYMSLVDRAVEIGEIIKKQNEFLRSEISNREKELAKKDAEIRIQEALMDAIEKSMEK